MFIRIFSLLYWYKNISVSTYYIETASVGQWLWYQIRTFRDIYLLRHAGSSPFFLFRFVFPCYSEGNILPERESTIGGLYIYPTTCLSEYRVYTSQPIICIPFTVHYTHKGIPSKEKMVAPRTKEEKGYPLLGIHGSQHWDLFVATMRHYRSSL